MGSWVFSERFIFSLSALPEPAASAGPVGGPKARDTPRGLAKTSLQGTEAPVPGRAGSLVDPAACPHPPRSQRPSVTGVARPGPGGSVLPLLVWPVVKPPGSDTPMDKRGARAMTRVCKIYAA